MTNLFPRWPGAGFGGYPPSSGYDYNGYNSVKEERITTVLQKGLRGFGFTIVGGDHPEEMLQVKSIVPGGPANVDGKIRIGDSLTKVNGMYVSL
jgi:C-terminal processing protease CtpA/Prc